HCRGTALLSDDLWQRLHPDARPRRWYLWARGEARPAESAASRHVDVHDHRRLPAQGRAADRHAYWLRVRIEQRCEACNSMIPLVALAPSVVCPACHAKHDLPDI